MGMPHFKKESIIYISKSICTRQIKYGIIYISLSIFRWPFWRQIGFFPSLQSQCLDNKRILHSPFFRCFKYIWYKGWFYKAIFKTLFRNIPLYFSCLFLETAHLFYSFHDVEQQEVSQCAVPPWAPLPLPILISQPGIALPSFTNLFILQIYLLFLCLVFIELKCPSYLFLQHAWPLQTLHMHI